MHIGALASIADAAERNAHKKPRSRMRGMQHMWSLGILRIKQEASQHRWWLKVLQNMAGDIATQVVARSTTREYQRHEALKHTISLRVLRGIAGGSATHVVAKSTTTNTENKGIATNMIARRIQEIAGGITTHEVATWHTKSMRQCQTYGRHR